MPKDENLRLFVIEESSGDAESLAIELRNSGHAVELTYAADLSSLEASLGKRSPDILICGSGDGLPDAATVRAVLDTYKVDAPVIAILDEAPEDQVVAARKAGISAVVSYDRPDHLHVVFAQEAKTAALRHALDRFTGRLLASEKRAHALIENSSDAIAYIHDGMHVYANRPYMDLFDIKAPQDIEGTPILDMISNSERDSFKAHLKKLNNAGDEERTLTIDCISPRGETFNSTMEFTPATMDGEPCTQILIRVNSGANSELEKKIRILSREDMLTGLWNRQYFMHLLEEQIRSGTAGKRQQALVYVTLDNFKVIREEAGIATSDLVLCDIANLLERQRGEHDLLARFGDYSFAMLKQDRDMEHIQSACEALLKEIAAHLSEIEGQAFTMTASIGICEIRPNRHDAQKTISYADMACEVARTSGGNQIHTHSNVVEESIGADMDQNADLFVRETIDNERFYLVFQPIVCLKGERSGRYEVLLRIVDAQGHVILPGQFLSIAERTGFATEVDRWVIDHTLRMHAEHPGSNQTIFYIKLTGSSMVDPDFPEWVSDRLHEYELDSAGIVFEISEQLAAGNLKQAIDFVSSVHSINCRVALEHFGLANKLQLLKHVRPDIVKIDGSLISTMSSDKDNQDKVRSIIEACGENGTVCIAECVDNAGILALLWQTGVDCIQGYFVQEPARELDYEFENEIV